jgi:hypothetical protein
MSRDFEELLASLNAARVRYVIGGAHALAFHARPRATKDLDVFVDPTPANARRLVSALAAFFGGSAPSYVDEATILDPDTIIQLGVAPVRVDIISRFATISFREAWRDSVVAPFGAVPARYLSREHLIAEKSRWTPPGPCGPRRAAPLQRPAQQRQEAQALSPLRGPCLGRTSAALRTRPRTPASACGAAP